MLRLLSTECRVSPLQALEIPWHFQVFPTSGHPENVDDQDRRMTPCDRWAYIKQQK